MREMGSKENPGEANADLNGPKKSPEGATQIPGTLKRKHDNRKVAPIPIRIGIEYLSDTLLIYSNS